MQNPARAILRVDDLDIAYAEGGEGPPVVYLHGALMTLDEGVISLYQSLASRYRAILFDRPGHGSSGRGLATGSPWRQAALVRRALDQMGVERPVIVGHSFGGAVAMAYALRFPAQAAGVVALAPIAFPELRLEHLLFGWRATPMVGEWLSGLATRVDEALLPALWGGMFAPQVTPAEFAAAFPFAVASSRREMKADGEEAAAMAADLARSALSYWTCRVPVRVLHGERDVVVNPMHGRGLAFQVPDGRFESLPGLGHMAHHFAQERVLAAVDELSAVG